MGGEGAFERRHGVAHGRGERATVVDEDEGAARAGAQARGHAAVPGGDCRRRRVAAQRRDQLRPLAVDRGRRSAQQDREGRRFAEAFALQRFAAGRGGAGDAEGGRLEVALDPEPDRAEDRDADHGRGEDRPGTAQVQFAQKPPISQWLRGA